MSLERPACRGGKTFERRRRYRRRCSSTHRFTPAGSIGLKCPPRLFVEWLLDVRVPENTDPAEGEEDSNVGSERRLEKVWIIWGCDAVVEDECRPSP